MKFPISFGLVILMVILFAVESEAGRGGRGGRGGVRNRNVIRNRAVVRNRNLRLARQRNIVVRNQALLRRNVLLRQRNVIVRNQFRNIRRRVIVRQAPVVVVDQAPTVVDVTPPAQRVIIQQRAFLSNTQQQIRIAQIRAALQAQADIDETTLQGIDPGTCSQDFVQQLRTRGFFAGRGGFIRRGGFGGRSPRGGFRR